MIKKIFFTSILCLLFPLSTLAINFAETNFWISDISPENGETVKLYTILVNTDAYPIEGSLMFVNTVKNEEVSEQIDFRLEAGDNSKLISRNWIAKEGTYRFAAQILNAYKINEQGERELLYENRLSKTTDTIFIQADDDGDGLNNQYERGQGLDPNNPDSDNDGVNDGDDPQPLNPDRDGDGDLDGSDPAPDDSSIFTPPDFDNDGIPDKDDTDIDNDGLLNTQENQIGTDSYDVDTDDDTVNDKDDYYPLDKNKSKKEIEVKNQEQANATTQNTSQDNSQQNVAPQNNNSQTIGNNRNEENDNKQDQQETHSDETVNTDEKSDQDVFTMSFTGDNERQQQSDFDGSGISQLSSETLTVAPKDPSQFSIFDFFYIGGIIGGVVGLFFLFYKYV